MGKLIDLTGQKFHRLIVIRHAENSKSGRVRWNCVCDCGNTVIVSRNDLRSNSTKSCGCLKLEFSIGTRARTHGMRWHPLYIVWCNIKARCHNPKEKGFKDYGGIGITVCLEWKESFQKFYDDMATGYEKSLQLDRIDNGKGYFKENCRWVTCKENCNNKRNNIKVLYTNTSMTMTQAVELAGYNYNTVNGALRAHGFYKDITLDNL
jgi:hypothetical protein